MKVYGLIGEKLGHSLSPRIHQSLFKKANIHATYGLFEVEQHTATQVVAAMKTLGIQGLNVTIPYKKVILEHVDHLSEEALKIGAVNTLYNDGCEVWGYNTDYRGFGSILKEGGIEPRGKSFYVLGAGGAAKSIVWYLKDHGAEVILVTRDTEKATLSFANAEIAIITYEQLETIDLSYGIINTTPVGMFPNIEKSPIKNKMIEKFEIAIDIVYNPEETLFLRQAKEAGLKTFGGLWMLVAQAIESERIWQQTPFEIRYEKEIYKEVRGCI